MTELREVLAREAWHVLEQGMGYRPAAGECEALVARLLAALDAAGHAVVRKCRGCQENWPTERHPTGDLWHWDPNGMSVSCEFQAEAAATKESNDGQD